MCVCAALCDVCAWVPPSIWCRKEVVDEGLLPNTHGQAGQALACRCAVCSTAASAMQLFAGGVTALSVVVVNMYTAGCLGASSLNSVCDSGLRVYIPWLCVRCVCLAQGAGHVSLHACAASYVLHAQAGIPFGGMTHVHAHTKRPGFAQQMDLIPVAVQLFAWPSGMPCTLPGCCTVLTAFQQLAACVHKLLFGGSFFAGKGPAA